MKNQFQLTIRTVDNVHDSACEFEQHVSLQFCRHTGGLVQAPEATHLQLSWLPSWLSSKNSRHQHAGSGTSNSAVHGTFVLSSMNGTVQWSCTAWSHWAPSAASAQWQRSTAGVQQWISPTGSYIATAHSQGLHLQLADRKTGRQQTVSGPDAGAAMLGTLYEQGRLLMYAWQPSASSAGYSNSSKQQAWVQLSQQPSTQQTHCRNVTVMLDRVEVVFAEDEMAVLQQCVAQCKEVNSGTMVLIQPLYGLNSNDLSDVHICWHSMLLLLPWADLQDTAYGQLYQGQEQGHSWHSTCKMHLSEPSAAAAAESDDAVSSAIAQATHPAASWINVTGNDNAGSVSPSATTGVLLSWHHSGRRLAAAVSAVGLCWVLLLEDGIRDVQECCWSSVLGRQGAGLFHTDQCQTASIARLSGAADVLAVIDILGRLYALSGGAIDRLQLVDTVADRVLGTSCIQQLIQQLACPQLQAQQDTLMVTKAIAARAPNSNAPAAGHAATIVISLTASYSLHQRQAVQQKLVSALHSAACRPNSAEVKQLLQVLEHCRGGALQHIKDYHNKPRSPDSSQQQAPQAPADCLQQLQVAAAAQQPAQQPAQHKPGDGSCLTAAVAVVKQRDASHLQSLRQAVPGLQMCIVHPLADAPEPSASAAHLALEAFLLDSNTQPQHPLPSQPSDSSTAAAAGGATADCGAATNHTQGVSASSISGSGSLQAAAAAWHQQHISLLQDKFLVRNVRVALHAASTVSFGDSSLAAGASSPPLSRPMRTLRPLELEEFLLSDSSPSTSNTACTVTTFSSKATCAQEPHLASLSEHHVAKSQQDSSMPAPQSGTQWSNPLASWSRDANTLQSYYGAYSPVACMPLSKPSSASSQSGRLLSQQRRCAALGLSPSGPGGSQQYVSTQQAQQPSGTDAVMQASLAYSSAPGGNVSNTSMHPQLAPAQTMFDHSSGSQSGRFGAQVSPLQLYQSEQRKQQQQQQPQGSLRARSLSHSQSQLGSWSVGASQPKSSFGGAMDAITPKLLALQPSQAAADVEYNALPASDHQPEQPAQGVSAAGSSQAVANSSQINNQKAVLANVGSSVQPAVPCVDHQEAQNWRIQAVKGKAWAQPIRPERIQVDRVAGPLESIVSIKQLLQGTPSSPAVAAGRLTLGNYSPGNRSSYGAIRCRNRPAISSPGSSAGRPGALVFNTRPMSAISCSRECHHQQQQRRRHPPSAAHSEFPCHKVRHQYSGHAAGSRLLEEATEPDAAAEMDGVHNHGHHAAARCSRLAWLRWRLQLGAKTRVVNRSAPAAGMPIAEAVEEEDGSQVGTGSPQAHEEAVLSQHRPTWLGDGSVRHSANFQNIPQMMQLAKLMINSLSTAPEAAVISSSGATQPVTPASAGTQTAVQDSQWDFSDFMGCYSPADSSLHSSDATTPRRPTGIATTGQATPNSQRSSPMLLKAMWGAVSAEGEQSPQATTHLSRHTSSSMPDMGISQAGSGVYRGAASMVVSPQVSWTARSPRISTATDSSPASQYASSPARVTGGEVLSAGEFSRAAEAVGSCSMVGRSSNTVKAAMLLHGPSRLSWRTPDAASTAESEPVDITTATASSSAAADMQKYNQGKPAVPVTEYLQEEEQLQSDLQPHWSESPQVAKPEQQCAVKQHDNGVLQPRVNRSLFGRARRSSAERSCQQQQELHRDVGPLQQAAAPPRQQLQPHSAQEAKVFTEKQPGLFSFLRLSRPSSRSGSSTKTGAAGVTTGTSQGLNRAAFLLKRTQVDQVQHLTQPYDPPHTAGLPVSNSTLCRSESTAASLTARPPQQAHMPPLGPAAKQDNNRAAPSQQQQALVPAQEPAVASVSAPEHDQGRAIAIDQVAGVGSPVMVALVSSMQRITGLLEDFLIDRSPAAKVAPYAANQQQQAHQQPEHPAFVAGQQQGADNQQTAKQPWAWSPAAAAAKARILCNRQKAVPHSQPGAGKAVSQQQTAAQLQQQSAASDGLSAKGGWVHPSSLRHEQAVDAQKPPAPAGMQQQQQHQHTGQQEWHNCQQVALQSAQPAKERSMSPGGCPVQLMHGALPPQVYLPMLPARLQLSHTQPLSQPVELLEQNAVGANKHQQTDSRANTIVDVESQQVERVGVLAGQALDINANNTGLPVTASTSSTADALITQSYTVDKIDSAASVHKTGKLECQRQQAQQLWQLDRQPESNAAGGVAYTHIGQPGSATSGAANPYASGTDSDTSDTVGSGLAEHTMAGSPWWGQHSFQQQLPCHITEHTQHGFKQWLHNSYGTWQSVQEQLEGSAIAIGPPPTHGAQHHHNFRGTHKHAKCFVAAMDMKLLQPLAVSHIRLLKPTQLRDELADQVENCGRRQQQQQQQQQRSVGLRWTHSLEQQQPQQPPVFASRPILGGLGLRDACCQNPAHAASTGAKLASEPRLVRLPIRQELQPPAVLHTAQHGGLAAATADSGTSYPLAKPLNLPSDGKQHHGQRLYHVAGGNSNRGLGTAKKPCAAENSTAEDTTLSAGSLTAGSRAAVLVKSLSQNQQVTGLRVLHPAPQDTASTGSISARQFHTQQVGNGQQLQGSLWEASSQPTSKQQAQQQLTTAAAAADYRPNAYAESDAKAVVLAPQAHIGSTQAVRSEHHQLSHQWQQPVLQQRPAGMVPCHSPAKRMRTGTKKSSVATSRRWVLLQRLKARNRHQKPTPPSDQLQGNMVQPASQTKTIESADVAQLLVQQLQDLMQGPAPAGSSQHNLLEQALAHLDARSKLDAAATMALYNSKQPKGLNAQRQQQQQKENSNCQQVQCSSHAQGQRHVRVAAAADTHAAVQPNQDVSLWQQQQPHMLSCPPALDAEAHMDYSTLQGTIGNSVLCMGAMPGAAVPGVSAGTGLPTMSSGPPQQPVQQLGSVNASTLVALAAAAGAGAGAAAAAAAAATPVKHTSSLKKKQSSTVQMPNDSSAAAPPPRTVQQSKHRDALELAQLILGAFDSAEGVIEPDGSSNTAAGLPEHHEHPLCVQLPAIHNPGLESRLLQNPVAGSAGSKFLQVVDFSADSFLRSAVRVFEAPEAQHQRQQHSWSQPAAEAIAGAATLAACQGQHVLSNGPSMSAQIDLGCCFAGCPERMHSPTFSDAHPNNDTRETRHRPLHVRHQRAQVLVPKQAQHGPSLPPCGRPGSGNKPPGPSNKPVSAAAIAHHKKRKDSSSKAGGSKARQSLDHKQGGCHKQPKYEELHEGLQRQQLQQPSLRSSLQVLREQHMQNSMVMQDEIQLGVSSVQPQQQQQGLSHAAWAQQTGTALTALWEQWQQQPAPGRAVQQTHGQENTAPHRNQGMLSTHGLQPAAAYAQQQPVGAAGGVTGVAGMGQHLNRAGKLRHHTSGANGLAPSGAAIRAAAKELADAEPCQERLDHMDLTDKHAELKSAFTQASSARAAAKAAAKRAAAARSQRLTVELADLANMLAEVDSLAAQMEAEVAEAAAAVEQYAGSSTADGYWH